MSGAAPEYVPLRKTPPQKRGAPSGVIGDSKNLTEPFLPRRARRRGREEGILCKYSDFYQEILFRLRLAPGLKPALFSCTAEVFQKAPRGILMDAGDDNPAVANPLFNNYIGYFRNSHPRRRAGGK